MLLIVMMFKLVYSLSEIDLMILSINWEVVEVWSAAFAFLLLSFMLWGGKVFLFSSMV